MNSREQFEKWATTYGLRLNNIDETEMTWDAWQASREALVVEIPKGLLLVEEADVIDDIVNQLDKAGIKWK